nr:MAG TPA: hypothetical protein [Caudoviricetes sp.]
MDKIRPPVLLKEILWGTVGGSVSLTKSEKMRFFDFKI